MKAIKCDGATCEVNGVQFFLVINPQSMDWSLNSKYDHSPLEELADCKFRLADAPYGLIKEFGQKTAYAMTDCALAAM